MPQRSAPPAVQAPAREAFPLRERLQQHQRAHQEKQRNVTALPQDPPGVSPGLQRYLI